MCVLLLQASKSISVLHSGSKLVIFSPDGVFANVFFPPWLSGFDYRKVAAFLPLDKFKKD